MYLAFDTETTGLEANSNVLTAYFIILDSDFNQIDNLNLQIKYPFYTVYPQALEVNKINLISHHNDINSLNVNLAMIKLSTFLEKNKKDNKYILLGHNVQFDIQMLINNNIFTQDIIDIYLDMDNLLDTFLYAKKLKNMKLIPYRQSLSLSKLIYYFDLNNININFHNAEDDIKVTILLYKKLKELELNN